MQRTENKINRFDNFTKCTQVVLGKINFSLLDLIDNNDEKNFVEHHFYEAQSSLDQIEKVFKKFDVMVYKPQPTEFQKGKTFITPFANIPAVNHSLAPFDNYLILENTIVEVPSIDPYSFFDYQQYQHIWYNFLNDKTRWISAPRPSYNSNLVNECLFDAPCFEPVGNVIFHTESGCLTKNGIEWVKNYFPKFKFIPVRQTKGHLDAYFSILKPGLIFSSIPKSVLPDNLQKWEVIEAPKENYLDRTLLNDFIQDDDFENTNLSVSSFNIDENNILIFDHVLDNHLDIVKKIEKHKINLIPITMKSSRFFGQGISCLTNALCRDGVMENYF